MSPSKSAAEADDFDAGKALKMLDAVERGRAKSQRALAHDMEVALGYANAYLKRCVRKGWVKVSAAPARRYLYYLTPSGFVEKARLTAEYLSVSLDMFRTARGQCDEAIAYCLKHGYRRIALAGVSDLAEIAILSSLSADLSIVAVIDSASNQERVARVRVVRSVEDAGDVDAVLVTDIRSPQETFEKLAKSIGNSKILTLPMLHISQRPLRLDGSEEAAQ